MCKVVVCAWIHRSTPYQTNTNITICIRPTDCPSAQDHCLHASFTLSSSVGYVLNPCLTKPFSATPITKGGGVVAISHMNLQISSIVSILAIIQAEIPFTNNTHEVIAFVYLEESITHKAQRTSHSASSTVTKEMLLLSWTSAWCACETHFIHSWTTKCLSKEFLLGLYKSYKRTQKVETFYVWCHNDYINQSPTVA